MQERLFLTESIIQWSLRPITDRITAVALASRKDTVYDYDDNPGNILNPHPLILMITGLITGTLPIKLDKDRETGRIRRVFGGDMATAPPKSH